MTTKTPPDAVAATLDTATKTSDVLNPGGGKFIAIVRGTFVANLRLQVNRDGSNWDDVFVFNAPDVVQFDSTIAGELFRLDMSGAGDFTSGSAGIYLGR